jgi:hypothetical protein
MSKYQRPPYYGILREVGKEEDQKNLKNIGYQRSGEKLK